MDEREAEVRQLGSSQRAGSLPQFFTLALLFEASVAPHEAFVVSARIFSKVPRRLIPEAPNPLTVT